MSAPVVLRVVISPACEPVSGVISRMVKLSDDSMRDETWDGSAWVLGDVDTWMLGNSAVLWPDDLVRLGIREPDPSAWPASHGQRGRPRA
jgi:hypothetical protein